MGFNIKDLNKIKDYTILTNVLNEYKGVLPKYLIPFVDIQEYEKNLQENNVYDKIQKEYYQIRVNRKKSKDHTQFDNDEFYMWLKNNPQIEELLIKLS